MSPTFQKDGQPFVGIPTGASFAFVGVQTRAAGDAVPSWVSIDSTTGTITTAPGANDVADDPYTVPVTVTYSDGTIDNVDAKIAVTEKAATDKAGLAAEIAKESEVKGADGFKNASQEKKQAYKDALAKADEVLKDSDATQAEVDAAKDRLANAADALNGEATHFDGLINAITDANTAKGTDAYKNASDDAKKALDEALAEAEAVRDNPKATQAEVDAAKEKLENAQKVLDGKETDKSGLQSSISDANGARGADSYKNATDGAKQAFDKALEAAEKVFNDPNASQAEVDAALKALNDASSALDGKTTADGKSGEKSVGAQLRKLAKTGAQTSWLWLSALLAGSGAVLVSKRRRKDEQDA